MAKSTVTKDPTWAWNANRVRRDKRSPTQLRLENAFLDEDAEVVEIFAPKKVARTYRLDPYHVEFLEAQSTKLGWGYSLFLREILDMYMTATGFSPEIDRFKERVVTIKELRARKKYKKHSPSANPTIQQKQKTEAEERRAKLLKAFEEREERRAKEKAERGMSQARKKQMERQLREQFEWNEEELAVQLKWLEEQ